MSSEGARSFHENLQKFYSFRRHKFATKELLSNTEYFYILGQQNTENALLLSHCNIGDTETTQSYVERTSSILFIVTPCYVNFENV